MDALIVTHGHVSHKLLRAGLHLLLSVLLLHGGCLHLLLLHSGVLLAHCLLSFLVIELLLGHHCFRLTSTENVALVRIRFLLLLWGSIAKNTALPLSLLLLLSIVRLLLLIYCRLSALTNAAHVHVVLLLLLVLLNAPSWHL